MQAEQDIPDSVLVRVYVLGPLEIWKKDSFGAWKLVSEEKWKKSRPARSVLKRLLVQPGRRLSREQLADDVWSESGSEPTDTTIYNAISLIRGVIGKSLVKLWGSAYEIAGQTLVWTDIDACDVLLKEAENQGHARVQALPLLEQALTLLERGELLEGEYGKWCYQFRKRAEDMLKQARLWLAEGYERQGKLWQAGEQYRAMILTNPSDEDALLCWLKMLYQHGKRQEALKCYQDMKDFVETQGFPLSNELEQMVASLNQQPTLALISPFKPFEGIPGSTFFFPSNVIQPEQSLGPSSSDCAIQFGVVLAQMVTLIQQWYGMAMFSHDLQNQLDREMKKLDGLQSRYPFETYTLSRRRMLFTLASIPATWLLSRRQMHTLPLELEEFILQCAASITACWHLSKGNHLEAIPPILDSYLPTLIVVSKHAPVHREAIADLIAQCYLLKSILAWHLENLVIAETYCIQATHYSLIANNSNLHLTALNQHALIFYYAKQFEKALETSEEASRVSQQISRERLFPIMQGRVSMYLAAFRAQQVKGNAEQVLAQAQDAFALQAATVESIPPYVDCGEASLTLWDGLTHYHLGRHDSTHTQYALSSLALFGRVQPNQDIPERFRLECLTNRTLAAIRANDMEEALACFTAGQQGAHLLESKQRTAEILFAYQEFVKRWPAEERVQKLGLLLEQSR